jgi:hypothetical protein
MQAAIHGSQAPVRANDRDWDIAVVHSVGSERPIAAKPDLGDPRQSAKALSRLMW